MPSPIDKQTLEHLAKLARIELGAHEEEKLLKDLGAILDHFEELGAVDTSAVEPMAGGTQLVNALREDTGRENTNRGKGVDAFPESENNALKVPPIF